MSENPVQYNVVTVNIEASSFLWYQPLFYIHVPVTLHDKINQALHTRGFYVFIQTCTYMYVCRQVKNQKRIMNICKGRAWDCLGMRLNSTTCMKTLWLYIERKYKNRLLKHILKTNIRHSIIPLSTLCIMTGAFPLMWKPMGAEGDLWMVTNSVLSRTTVRCKGGGASRHPGSNRDTRSKWAWPDDVAV